MEGKVWLVLVSVSMILLSSPIFSMQQADATVTLENPETRAFNDLPFINKRLYHEDDLVYRATSADLMADHPGMELATCSKNGKVVVTYGTRSSWTSKTVHRSTFTGGASESAQVYSLESGDIIPEDEGDELIAVDESYAVNLIRYNEEAGLWSSDIIWKDTDWLYEVDVGELVGTPDQLEIVVVGEQKRATMLSRDGNTWVSTTIATDSDIFEACWIADIYPERPGNEVLLGGGRGILFVSYLEDGLWRQEEIMDLEDQITDLLVVDMDPSAPGEEAYASTIIGDVWKVWMSDGNWTKALIHSEGKLIYGMETGEYRGSNILSIGTWNNRVGIIWYEEGFQFQEIYREEYLVMGTAILDIDPAHEGNEILSLSYLGRVTMIYQEEPGAEIVLPFHQTSLNVGETVRIPFIIESRGGYQGPVDISSKTDKYLQVKTADNRIEVDSISFIEVTGLRSSPPFFMVPIYANTSLGSTSQDIIVHINDGGPEMDLLRPRSDVVVKADSQTSISFDMNSASNESFFVHISSYLKPQGFDISDIEGSSELDPGISKISGTLSAEAWVPTVDYRFFITIQGPDSRFRAMGIEVLVNERVEPAFRLQLEGSMVSIPVGGNATVMMNVISENGFDENVTLTFSPEIDGISITLSQEVIQPTGSIEVFIEVLDGYEGYLITLTGSSTSLDVDVYLYVLVLPPKKDLDFSFEPLGYEFMSIEDNEVISDLWVILTPKNGEISDLMIRIDGLPLNFTISFFPGNIQRLFYPLNISFTIAGPRDEAPDHLKMNITSLEDGTWEIDIPLILETDDGDKPDDGPPYLLIFVIGTLVLIAALLGFFLRYLGTRDLNHVEVDEGANERDASIRRRSAAPERFNGSGSGRDRIYP